MNKNNDIFNHQSGLIRKGQNIYYDLKFSNIYDNKNKTRKFEAKDFASTILEKQNNYKMAIQSFRLDMIIPLFLFPIKEGFVNKNITISNITNAEVAVITTTNNNDLAVNDYINIQGVNGMTQIKGTFFVNSIVSPTQFTIKKSLDLENKEEPVNSINYGNYTNGGNILTVNDDINLSDLGLCLSYDGDDFPSPVYYISDVDLNNQPEYIPKSPKENNGVQDNSTYYYFAYSFNVFVEMVNNAFKASTDALNASKGTTYEQPFLDYLESERFFRFVVPYNYVEDGIEIFLEDKLQRYLAGLRYISVNSNNPNFKDMKLVVENRDWTNSTVKKGGVLPVPPAPPLYVQMKQEYDTRYKFDEIVSIVLTSSFIKTRTEYYPKIGNPNSYIQNGRSDNSFNTGTLNIISTFDLIDEGGTVSWNEKQYYQPKIYKWIDLISDDVLNKVDVNVFFETKKGDLIPAFVDVNSQSVIRFIFERIK